jgi:acyl carrier protein
MEPNQKSKTLARIVLTINRALGANLEVAEIQSSSRLNDLLGLDSMAQLEYVTALEQEFQITFPAECLRLDFLVNLHALAEYLAKAVPGIHPCGSVEDR